MRAKRTGLLEHGLPGLLALTALIVAPAEVTATQAPRLYRVIVPARDIAESAEFYSRLFEIEGERVSPGRHYFDLGGTILAVYDPAADGDDAAGWRHHPNQYIYISVADLEAAFRKARELGATLESEIESMPWGERLFYARDPGGIPICLVDSETLFLGSEGATGE